VTSALLLKVVEAHLDKEFQICFTFLNVSLLGKQVLNSCVYSHPLSLILIGYFIVFLEGKTSSVVVLPIPQARALRIVFICFSIYGMKMNSSPLIAQFSMSGQSSSR
jgi:hypothetical protein